MLFWVVEPWNCQNVLGFAVIGIGYWCVIRALCMAYVWFIAIFLAKKEMLEGLAVVAEECIIVDRKSRGGDFLHISWG